MICAHPEWGRTQLSIHIAEQWNWRNAAGRLKDMAARTLLLKLRTPLDSAASAVDDQVDAVLWSPVIQDGVELIPEGSVVLGKVVEVAAATRPKPLGRIAFTFSIVEHSETGSRAMLTTRKVVFEAQPPQTEGKKPSKELVNAVVPAGTAFVAMTAEPLLVRIPK